MTAMAVSQKLRYNVESAETARMSAAGTWYEAITAILATTGAATMAPTRRIALDAINRFGRTGRVIQKALLPTSACV